MSDEEQETIADIVADIRAQNQGLPEDSYALSPLVCDLLSFADRIDAAHKREVAELREENARLRAALKPVLDIVMDSATSDLSMEIAIKEAKRVYWSSSAKGKGGD